MYVFVSHMLCNGNDRLQYGAAAAAFRVLLKKYFPHGLGLQLPALVA